MESVNNQSFIPLNTQRIYIGSWDNVTIFPCAVISLFSDTDCEIIAYQSQNKTNYYPTQFDTTGGTQFTTSMALSSPYVYFTVKNTSVTNQTKLQFTVIYHPVFVPNEVTLGTAVSVVSQTAGLALDATLQTINSTLSGISSLGSTAANQVIGNNSLSSIVTNTNPLSSLTFDTPGNLKVIIEANATDFSSATLQTAGNSSLSTISTNSSTIASNTTNLNTLNFDGSDYLNTHIQANSTDYATNTTLTAIENQALNNGGLLWNAASISDGSTSSIVNLTTKMVNGYSYFGNVSGAATLTIQYSGDGITFYSSSNIITTLSSSDFSIDTLSGAGYVRMIATGIIGSVTCTAILNHFA